MKKIISFIKCSQIKLILVTIWAFFIIFSSAGAIYTISPTTPKYTHTLNSSLYSQSSHTYDIVVPAGYRIKDACFYVTYRDGYHGYGWGDLISNTGKIIMSCSVEEWGALFFGETLRIEMGSSKNIELTFTLSTRAKTYVYYVSTPYGQEAHRAPYTDSTSQVTYQFEVQYEEIIPATLYTVSFNANGGSVSSSTRSVKKGATIGTLPTPTRNGYTFDGWYTSASGGTKITSSTIVTGNVTYYAHWTAIPLSPEYNVYFDADGGSASFNIKLVARGETVGSLPTATMDGYIFDGWYTAKSGGVKVTTSSIITKDVTYYAHWCYEVVFSGNDGMATENRRILPKGSRIGTLPTATRNGYKFTGWYSEVNVKTSGLIVVPDSKVSESTVGNPDESGSLVLYAGWSLISGGFDLRFGTPAGRKWTQGFFLSADENATTGMTSFSDGDVIYWNSFIYNDGTEVIDGDFVVKHRICDAAGRGVVSFNQYESLEYKPNTGYVRANQRWDEGFQSLPPGAYIYECIIDSQNNIPETGDLELNDRFEYPFTIVQDGQRVRFDSNGGSLNETSRCVSKNSSIGNLPVPVRSGYSFDGWYTSPIGGSKITSSTIVYGERTYYARWIALRKVIFNANGGEVPLGTKTVLDGEVIGSLPVPTRNGFRFNGWYLLDDGRRVYENMCLNSDMTLYAYWVKPTVKTVPALGCEAMGSVIGGMTTTVGTKISLKATASKGFVFAGWYEDSVLTIPCDSSGIDYRNLNYSYVMGAEDKTFYARFEPVAVDTNLNLMVDGVAITSEDTPLKSFSVGSATNLSLVIDSLSLPKASVKGLPAGMKFTEKPIFVKGSKTEIETPANSIYGTPTKPGVYKVSVSLTNTSIKKAIVNDFEIVVPNLTDGLIPVGDEYGPYVTGVAYTNTIVTAAGCTVTGLPAGMKWTAKDILGSKTKLVAVPANSAYGAPTKPGKYTVYFTKTIDKVKHTATATFIVGEFPIVNVVTIGSGTGKVTGTGAFAANKKVTLKATADTKDDAKKGTKKSVFAGWYYSRTDGSSVQDMNAQAARSTSTTGSSPVDEANLVPVESTVDFRVASLPYVMAAAPTTTLYALFVTAEEDSDVMLYVKDKEITANANDNNFVAEGTTILSLQMESISIPKASLSGLPAGMKYTDKALTVKATKTEEAYDVPANAIYGTPTKPGLYTVTVKLTNATIKKAIEKKFTIIVPNYTDANHYFEDDYFGYDGNATADGRLNLSVGITNLDDFLPSLRMNSPTAKLAVSGLPAGLKYDAKTGKIIGIATKPGAYTVTLTVTDGKAKYVSTITIEVEALPDWVVGTFNGVEYDRPAPYEEDEVPWEGGNFWDVTMTVSSVGKVSGKLFETNGKVMYTVEGVLIDNNDGSFMIKGWASDEKDDVEYLPITKSYSYGGVELGRIDFESDYYWEDGERWVQDWMLIQDVYSNYPKSEKIPTFRKGVILKDEITDSDIGISGEVRLSFDSKGVVVGEFKPFANIHMTQSKDTGRLILASYDECEDVVYAYVLMSFTHTSNYNYKNHIGMIYKLKIKNLSDVTSNSIEIVEAFYRYD